MNPYRPCWPGARRLVASRCGPWLFAAAGAAAPMGAAAVSDASFVERAENVFGSDLALAEHVAFDASGFHAEATTSADDERIPGAGAPYAEATIERGWSSPFGIAHAKVTYYFELEGPPLPPDVVGVPVIIDGVLRVESDAAALGYGFASAQIDVLAPHVHWYSVLEACVADACADRSEDPSLVALMAPGDIETRIVLEATVELHRPPMGSVLRMRALADPHIGVDPSFAYADDYRIVVSEGVINTPAVPEASTLALLCAGLLGLALRRRPWAAARA